MKIIVCCKVVPEEQDIIIREDGKLDLSRAAVKISQYDLNALECAAQLAGPGDEIIALAAGEPKTLEGGKIRKDILSRGPARLEIVAASGMDGALPDVTATVLAEAIEKIGFDLVLCGEGSGDLYAQQTGLLLGEKLGVPAINAVNGVSIEGGSVVAERDLERETEIVELPLPALLCVSSDINTPRIPTMKAILSAGKKPVSVQERDTKDIPRLSVLESVMSPQGKARLNEIVEGDSEDNIARFAEMIRKAMQ